MYYVPSTADFFVVNLLNSLPLIVINIIIMLWFVGPCHHGMTHQCDGTGFPYIRESDQMLRAYNLLVTECRM